MSGAKALIGGLLEADDYIVAQFKDGKRDATVSGMGRNKGTWDATHSRRSAQRHAKALRSKNDGYVYKTEKNLESEQRLNMSRAKRIIEMMCPAPVVEPKPGVKPAAPGRPAPRPNTRPNPFRRREIRPGEEPRPKAAMEAVLGNKSLKQPASGGKAPHAFAKRVITGKTSGTGASGLTAKKAFKK